MNNKVVSSIIAAAALTSAASAGEQPVAQVEAPASSACDTLKSIGKLYSDDSNPYIQEVKVFGRAQWQYGYVDGDQASEGYNEFRRLRAGAEVKFLNYFSAMARANLATGGADNHRFGFDSYDEIQASFNFGKAFGIDTFDKAALTYGLDKINFGEDVHTSSKKIKTVERSAITGKGRGDNRTGVIIDLEKGDWSGSFGVYNADEQDHRDALADLGDDQLFYASSTFGLETGELILDFIYNSDAGEAGNDYGNKWASSVAYRTEVATWDLALNAIVGEDADNETFYGFVVQPSKFLIEDKLEVVGRYYFQGSESDNGIKPNSRYSRQKVRGTAPLSVTSGDKHHSVYAGLNYYLCGDNAKIMTGVEYETIEDANNNADATTLWGAVRFYF